MRWKNIHFLLVASVIVYSTLRKMQFSISKMSIVSLLFFIGLQVNQSIAVPVFRDAASMAFAIQHQPELFRLQAAQPTGLR
jgi:hypothetical protein